MVHKNTDTFTIDTDQLTDNSGASLLGFVSVLLLSVAAFVMLLFIQA